MKTRTAPLCGYPYTHAETAEFEELPKAQFAELLKVAAGRAELIHDATMAIYFDYAQLVRGTRNKALTDRLEHSARILENVAYQLHELTASAALEISNENHG